MRNISITLLCLTILSFSCGKQLRPTENLVREDGTISLAPYFKAGESYKMTISLKESMKATDSPNGSWKMSNLMNQQFECKVKSVDKNGVSEHEAIYKHCKVRFSTSPGPSMAYDSDLEPENPMQEHFQALIGTTFSFSRDSYGKVTTVKGAQPLIGEMLPESGDYTGNDHFRESMNLDFIYPGQAVVAVGDKWDKEMSLASFYPMKMNNKYKLESIEAGNIQISFSGLISPHLNPVPTSEMGMSLNYELNGVSKGSYQLEQKSGRILNGNYKLSLNGACSLNAGEGKKFNFPVTIDKTVAISFNYENQ